jgi:hypothetical protein
MSTMVVSRRTSGDAGSGRAGWNEWLCLKLRVSRNLGKVTPMPRWRVDILRKHAEHLGIVTAPNAQER